jgi:hypothetical protein
VNVFSKRIDSKQIDETLIVLVPQQRIKVIHQSNIERELKLKLQRVKTQSAALKQSRNNSVSENIFSQTLNTIFSSDLCIQTMIACYFFIDITQLTLIFKNEFQAVNIFKLINDHILNSVNKQDLRLTRFDEL